MDSADDSLELSPELFDGIGVNHTLDSILIRVSPSEFLLGMIRGGMVVAKACNGVGYSHIRTEESSRHDTVLYEGPQSLFFYIYDAMYTYSSRFSLYDSEDDLLILLSSEPRLVRFGLS